MSLKFRFKALGAIRSSHISRQVIPLEQALQTCYIFRRYRSHRPPDSLCATKCYDNGHPEGKRSGRTDPRRHRLSLTRGEDQENANCSEAVWGHKE